MKSPPERHHISLQKQASLLLLCIVVALGAIVDSVEAQSANISTSPITDPNEASVLNRFFFRWGISANGGQWNISGELCSGLAVNDSTAILNMLSPAIKCDCSYSSGTTCHITSIQIFYAYVQGGWPEEISNLTYLTYLDLSLNNLTGPLPASIRDLSRLEYLNIGVNSFTGELPRELGELAFLTSLNFNTNNFSGPLPLELGNLSRLTELYFPSSGVSGVIPSTFANLRSLQSLVASDNDLTGRIPDFIGDFSNLNSLEFRGNSFQGPIPSSLSNLTSMTDLRISDISGGSYSLDFLENMTSLSTLVLRNNNFSGVIPQFFQDFTTLSILDLSFNSLSGTIPTYVYDLASLRRMFLGNNMFTGGLPETRWSLSNLQIVDLSYNKLHGSLPPWISERSLQINLVGNNFRIQDLNNSGLPPGLECLQRDMGCNRGALFRSTFAINCGGPTVNSSDGRVVYDMDTAVGPATYYVSGTGGWGVSNVGLALDNENQQFLISTTTSVFTNTPDPTLFRTTRTSAGSLRYYGLGLENGNYTVTLHFGETTNVGNQTNLSTGRRIFNIYIQGNLEERDFDMRREAGGVDFRAVPKQFQAQVINNYLEIHLFWAGKGTCCLPLPGTYGPSISAIHVTPEFPPTVRLMGRSSRNQNGTTSLIVGVVVAIGAICSFALAALCYLYRRRKMQKYLEDEELLGIDVRPYVFAYSELKAATEDFNPSNKLGQGGFGPVYKGTLADGRLIAVKRLSVASHHGKNQFLAEIATITAVRHRNLVKLYGCCIEGVERLLVYEYLENRSLDQILFGIAEDGFSPEWPMRYDICLGVAKGLAYLHEEARPRIVHRDVKASNILLDSDFTPKISDFGLAKLYDDKETHISTKIAGTRGYLAPEYAMLGLLTEKADIFSFGVVALEMISGRPNSDASLEDEKIYLLELAWNLHENNSLIELVDPALCEFDEAVVRRVIDIGLLCTQASPGSRPPMSRVVAMLMGDIEVPEPSSRPGYLNDWKFTDSTNLLCDTDWSSSNAAGSHTSVTPGTAMECLPSYSPVNPAEPMLSRTH